MHRDAVHHDVRVAAAAGPDRSRDRAAMPGASSARPMKLRLAMGRLSTDSVETVKERSPVVA
jgi:hypothetical protein